MRKLAASLHTIYGHSGETRYRHNLRQAKQSHEFYPTNARQKLILVESFNFVETLILVES
jgi:hypothetical protein